MKLIEPFSDLHSQCKGPIIQENIEKWDRDYLELCYDWAKKKSKDPSTKVGAVVVRPNKTVASLGYNGFPRGIPDLKMWLNNREEKYKRMVHAEMNAILNSAERLDGYTLYTYPLRPCHNCALHIIQVGIKRVVSVALKQLRWEDSHRLAVQLFKEAGVEYVEYENL